MKRNVIAFHIDNTYSFFDLFDAKKFFSELTINDELIIIFPSAMPKESSNFRRLWEDNANVKITFQEYNLDSNGIEIFIQWLSFLRISIDNDSNIIYISSVTHGLAANLLEVFLSRSAQTFTSIGYLSTVPRLVDKSYFLQRDRQHPKGIQHRNKYTPKDLMLFKLMTDQEFDCDFDESKIDYLYCHSYSWAKQYAKYFKYTPIIAPPLEKNNSISHDYKIELSKRRKKIFNILCILDIYANDSFMKSIAIILKAVNLSEYCSAINLKIKTHPRSKVNAQTLLKALYSFIAKLELNLQISLSCFSGTLKDSKNGYDLIIGIPSSGIHVYSGKNSPIIFICYDYFILHAKYVGFHATPNIHEYLPATEDCLPIYIYSEILEENIVHYSKIKEISNVEYSDIERKDFSKLITGLKLPKT